MPQHNSHGLPPQYTQIHPGHKAKIERTRVQHKRFRAMLGQVVRAYSFQECEVVPLGGPTDFDSFPGGPAVWGIVDDRARKQASRPYWDRGWCAQLSNTRRAVAEGCADHGPFACLLVLTSDRCTLEFAMARFHNKLVDTASRPSIECKHQWPESMEQWNAMLGRSLADAETTLFTNKEDEAVCLCAFYKACLTLDGTPLERA